MRDTLLAAVFLNFSGAAGFNAMLIGRQNLSPLTNRLFWLLTIVGVFAILSAMFLFIKDQGLQYGAIYWGGSEFAFNFIVIFFLTGAADGLRSILALLALGAGAYFAMRSFMPPWAGEIALPGNLLVAAYVIAAVVLSWLGTILQRRVIFVALAAVLAFLKLSGVPVLSWWWAALPLWGALGATRSVRLFPRYLFSIRKLNREPEQHELAKLFIDYVEGRQSKEALFEFLEPRRWSRDVWDLRITHALSLIKVHRRDVYPQACEIGQLLLLGRRQGPWAEGKRAFIRTMATQESGRE